MRVPGMRHRTWLVPLFFFLCIPPLSAQGQDQAPPVTRSPHRWLDPNVKDEYKKWLNEEVVFIITDQERAYFKKLLSDKERDAFVVAFWERRNPTPGAPENKFKEEHYRRIAYANTHFAAGIPGWKTDRGRMYILFGPPDSIDHHPNSAGQHSREIWHYRLMKGIGDDVDLEFVDTCECGVYQLTIGTSEKLAPLRNPEDRALRVMAIVSWHKFLDEDVRWIITDRERSDLLNLTTNEQRDEFITAFWERRNPTPGSTENAFKEEHYRRFAYTNEHFAADIPGWKTDRGRFYIMYGPPDSVDSKHGLAPPTETWHYRFIEVIGQNVVLSFTDKCVCGKYELSGGDAESSPNPHIFDPPRQ